MKIPSLIALLAALFTFATPQPAQARVEVSFDFFYDSLAPYGEWIEVADYGYCWRPTQIEADWRPYSDGYWAYTDGGWTWVSYEEFGGVVYHYGRWFFVDDEGWCWKPDTEWAPAWVSWRSSAEYVGWAPLPPEAAWSSSTGFSVWVDTAYDIAPSTYNFCHVRDFGAPVLRPVLITNVQNLTVIRTTVNVTNVTYNSYGEEPVIYNGGPSFVVINERSAHRIPTLKLVREKNLNAFRSAERGSRGQERFERLNAHPVGNQLMVAAPFVKPLADLNLLKPGVKKFVAADRVTRGWSGVRDGRQREEIRQQFRQEARGQTPQNAPARAVAVAELKAVPVTADPKAPSAVASDHPQRERKDRHAVQAPTAVEAPATLSSSATAPSPTPSTPSAPRPAESGATPAPAIVSQPPATLAPQQTERGHEGREDRRQRSSGPREAGQSPAENGASAAEAAPRDAQRAAQAEAARVETARQAEVARQADGVQKREQAAAAAAAQALDQQREETAARQRAERQAAQRQAAEPPATALSKPPAAEQETQAQQQAAAQRQAAEAQAQRQQGELRERQQQENAARQQQAAEAERAAAQAQHRAQQQQQQQQQQAQQAQQAERQQDEIRQRQRQEAAAHQQQQAAAQQQQQQQDAQAQEGRRQQGELRQRQMEENAARHQQAEAQRAAQPAQPQPQQPPQQQQAPPSSPQTEVPAPQGQRGGGQREHGRQKRDGADGNNAPTP